MIGSEGCTIDLYNIRVYDNDLNQYQMLDNFIGDLDDYDKALAIYNRNQVYNDYGDITYQKVLERLPCLIFEGPLLLIKAIRKQTRSILRTCKNPGDLSLARTSRMTCKVPPPNIIRGKTGSSSSSRYHLHGERKDIAHIRVTGE